MTSFMVRIKAVGEVEIVVDAENIDEAEEMVWEQLGDYGENIDMEDLEFTDFDVRAWALDG